MHQATPCYSLSLECRLRYILLAELGYAGTTKCIFAMASIPLVKLSEIYVLNVATKHLAREILPARNTYGDAFPAGDPRGQISEAWRFPIIDRYANTLSSAGDEQLNKVTFVVRDSDLGGPKEVAVIGSFAGLYEQIPLQPVLFMGEPTGFRACSLLVPKQQLHIYRFMVDGQPRIDPINPQQRQLDNGSVWSLFFTEACSELITFQPWEARLLARLTEQILPFRTGDGEQFLKNHVNFLDRQTAANRFPLSYRLDNSVGAVNFIDKILSREERHHRSNYRICLGIIDTLLRQRNSFVDTHLMSREMYAELYEQMLSGPDGTVPGWPYGEYGRPRFFMELLRRHTYTGAFSHPKYGGNAGAAGWQFLASRYPFDWQAALEAPLGRNTDYRG